MIVVAVIALLGVVLAWPRRPLSRRAAALAPVPPLSVPRGAIGAVVLLATIVISPVVPVVAVVAVRAWSLIQARRAVARHRWTVVQTLPEASDLVALAVTGGLTVPLAVAAAGRWAADPVGAAFRTAARQVELGAPAAEALAELPARLGEPVRPLVTALLASERYGVPLGESLDRVAREARLERQRRAEERARRVPVLLLFPLVLCVLPAFGLLTVVPLLVGSLSDLPR